MQIEAMIAYQNFSSSFILEFYAVAKFAGNGCVAKFDFRKLMLFAAVRQARFKRFGIDVKTDGATLEFRQI